MAVITQINNMLPRFSGASKNDKYSSAKIMEITELALLINWCRALDLKGFIPMEHSKNELLAECKALERNEKSKHEKKKFEKKQKIVFWPEKI